ncbi:MAG: VOC family protein [Planctomycetota bacterium]
MPKPAPVVHFEIGCKDLAKTRQFYGDLLGWQYGMADDTMAMVGNLGPKASPATEGVGGHLTALGHEPHQYVTVYAEVEDIEATLEHAEELGGSTVVPKQEVPGMGSFAWLADPEGNVVGLWTSIKG